MNENRLNTKLNRVDEAIGTLRQKLKLNENDPVEKVVEKTELKNHLNIFIQDTEPETKEGIWIKTAETLPVDKIVIDEVPFVEMEAVNYSLFPTIDSNIQNGKAVNVGEYIYFWPSDTTTKRYRLHVPTWTLSQISFPAGRQIYGKDPCVVGTDIYLMGNDNTTSYDPKACWKYDTINDTWTELANFPAVPNASVWSAVYMDGFIYMLWAKGPSGKNRDVYKYEITTDTWHYVTELPYDFPGSKRCFAHGKSICTFSMKSTNSSSSGVWDYEYNRVLYFNTETFETSTSTLFSGGFTNMNSNRNANKPNYGYVIGDIYYALYKYSSTGNYDNGYQVVAYDLKEKKQIKQSSFDTTMWRGDAYDTVFVPYGNIIFNFGLRHVNNGRSLDAFSLITKEYDNNTLVIMQGKNNPLAITTELFHVDGLAEGRILYPVFNVARYTTEDGLNYKLNLYYGDGETWHNYRQ